MELTEIPTINHVDSESELLNSQTLSSAYLLPRRDERHCSLQELSKAKDILSSESIDACRADKGSSIYLK